MAVVTAIVLYTIANIMAQWVQKIYEVVLIFLNHSIPSFFDICNQQLIWNLLQKYFSNTLKKESWIRLHEDFYPIVRFYVAPKWPSVLYAMLPLHKFGFDRKTMGFLSMITCDVNCNFFAIAYRNWIYNSFDPDLFFRWINSFFLVIIS